MNTIFLGKILIIDNLACNWRVIEYSVFVHYPPEYSLYSFDFYFPNIRPTLVGICVGKNYRLNGEIRGVPVVKRFQIMKKKKNTFLFNPPYLFGFHWTIRPFYYVNLSYFCKEKQMSKENFTKSA